MQLNEPTDFFEGITPDEVPGIVRIAEMNRKYARNSYIFRAGDMADSVYILTSGRVRLSRLSETGKNVIYLIVGSKSIFGEADILGNEFYSNDAQALDDCVVSSIKKADFIALLQMYPALLVRLHKILAERWKEAQEQIALLGTLSVREKVVAILKRYVGQEGVSQYENGWWALTLNQQDIGELAGATRESVNKAFSELKRDEVLRLRGHVIEVADVFVNAEAQNESGITR